MNYENLTDEQKEVYAFVINKYLGFGNVTIEQITPKIAQIVDDFLKAMSDCTKRLKIFTNIFSKASTIFGLVIAIGKEAAKEELNNALSKTISLPCYTAGFRNYQDKIYMEMLS